MRKDFFDLLIVHDDATEAVVILIQAIRSVGRVKHDT